jgi:hypothetical protein
MFLILGEVGIDFSFSAHLNQSYDLRCADIIEMIAQSNPILIPDISR